MFRWTLYKADISIKQTLLSCTNGVQFRDSFVQPKTLVLIINFFSLNFTSVEIEGERVSSSQNKHTLGGGGGGGGDVLENKQG